MYLVMVYIHELDKLKIMADFSCELRRKFKIEELFERLLKFTEQLHNS